MNNQELANLQNHFVGIGTVEHAVETQKIVLLELSKKQNSTRCL